MNKTIIHMSDLHFRQNWDEDQDVVLDEFFKDLGKQIQPIDVSNVYVVFSGDFVLKGGDQDLFDKFFLQFDTKLSELGIPREQRICVPGNHDISQDAISKDLINHEAVIGQNLSEGPFNDYLTNPSANLLLRKFSNYKTFETNFASMGISADTLSGAGWMIDENIGIYCLNTAFCSSGGVKKDGKEISDFQRLAIGTRDLQKWNLGCKANTKILVMHHPIEWLTEWAKVEIKKIVHKNFSLNLSGHVHDQDLLHSLHNYSSLVECSAPPLLTNKYGSLGYSMINISPEHGVIEIKYRQWTKRRSFVSGVDFSNTDDGIVHIKKHHGSSENVEAQYNKAMHDILSRHLKKKLDDALRSFSTQPIVWVEPVLNKVSDIATMNNPQSKIEPNVVISDFVASPKSAIIKAPPQFGLTCLAHYLCKEAWDSKEAYWVYLDSGNLKPDSIEKSVNSELQILGCDIKEVKCIILDSWSDLEKKSLLLVEKLCMQYQNTPIIVMQTIDDTKYLLNIDSSHKFKREFNTLYLWPLSRASIRKIITDYNNERYIGDVDAVIAKVTADLEVLNLHRTPLNCLTLLKVSEVDFDESPVNRTELINRILFILFNMDHIPTFKGRPDLKDCEYVLGYFCETMIRENKYSFTKEEFLDKLQWFCTEKVIDLDIQVVFDVLYHNNILADRDGVFCFRFSYWIFYFTAQRMHHDNNFADYVLQDMRYASFPEIIEFYTGIDRRREDALSVLIEDMQSVINTVDEKLGLPQTLNPYKFAQWKPSQESLQNVQNELIDSVKESRLPDSVKDQYADRNYDHSRPYHQEIQRILQEYSLMNLIMITMAAARALRNSDYANPMIKRGLLDLIMQSIEQLSKVLIILTPILATEGSATLEGTRFLLGDGFNENKEQRINEILSSIPSNVVSLFQHDLFSRKMGPLLIDRLNTENPDLTKHSLILLLIAQRPRDWKDHVQDYITDVSKNSFYLMDTYRALLREYRYGFISNKTLADIKYLVKMVHVKHTYGVKEPSAKAINKISDKMLPNRKVE